MDIKIEGLTADQLKPKNLDNLAFGTQFTDRMFIMEYIPDRGWHNPRIQAYQDLHLPPSTMVFHYAQEIFEGMKAFKQADGGVAGFRFRDNFERMNRSAERLCMPRLDVDFVMKAIIELIKLEKDWVPAEEGTALYVRPTMIGTDPIIKVRASDNYSFFIILSPVGAYFQTGFNCAKILVETDYVRAVHGGIGDAKTGGNYASSIKAGQNAAAQGYQQVLWLDAIKREYVEEVGAMNIFFVVDDQLITPKLSGSILPGITRKCVLELAPQLGLKAEERDITIQEVIENIQSGRLSEIFGCGTACVISPVGTLGYKGNDFVVNENKVGKCAHLLFEKLTNIQSGRDPDQFGWLVPIS